MSISNQKLLERVVVNASYDTKGIVDSKSGVVIRVIVNFCCGCKDKEITHCLKKKKVVCNIEAVF